MKKQLLIGSALLIALGTYSQNGKQEFKPSGVVNMGEVLKAKYAAINMPDAENNTNVAGRNYNPSPNPKFNPTNSGSEISTSSPIISAAFNRFSGSMNVFGMLVSNSKPLSYNRYFTTFAFVQRKSATYSTTLSANAQSGAIVMYLGKNEGANWDSTLVYSDNTNWSRYPSGGIQMPPTATSIAQCYVVASGPNTSGTNWVGSYRASKLIGAAGTTVAGSDQQFFPNSGTYTTATSPTMTKHWFPRQSWASTEDGIVRVAGQLETDGNNTTSNLGIGFRGAHISKGVFTAGAMVWSPDSMVPQFIQRSDGSNQADGNVYMAWNDAGNIGYVMMLGARFGATLQNKAWQPIIYKTTNSGLSWVLIPGIDFNAPGNMYNKLLNSMGGVNNTSVTAPFFQSGEGVDMVVDANGKLHIASLAIGAASPHQDSLEYSWQYTVTNQPTTEKYNWLFRKNAFPYLCDFSGDGTGTWSMTVIDSLGTQAPSATSGNPGFSSNPWASSTAGNSVNSDARIQISRSYDGQFMVYSWADSDTSVTTNAVKWNQFPNVHQRALRLCDNQVSTDGFLITAPTAGANANVKNHAYFHYMGSTCKAGASTLTQATFTVPYTVSNNATATGTNPVNNYFCNAIVTHSFATAACGATVTTGINASKTEASQSMIYPNPTKNNFNVTLSLTQPKEVSVDVYNAIGQSVSSVKTNGQLGENVININLNNANSGIYFVKIKTGTSESTKKLIVE